MNKEVSTNSEAPVQATQWDALQSSEERARMETPKTADFKYDAGDGREAVDHYKVFTSPQFAQYLETVAAGKQTDGARLAQKVLGIEVPERQQNVAEYVQAQLDARHAQADAEGRSAFDSRKIAEESVANGIVRIAEDDARGVASFDKRNNGSVSGIVQKIEDGFFNTLDKIESEGGEWKIEVAQAPAIEGDEEAPIETVEEAPAEKAVEEKTEEKAEEEKELSELEKAIENGFEGLSAIEIGKLSLQDPDFVKKVTARSRIRKVYGFNGGIKGFNEMVARVNGERGLDVLPQDEKKLTLMGEQYKEMHKAIDKAAEIAVTPDEQLIRDMHEMGKNPETPGATDSYFAGGEITGAEEAKTLSPEEKGSWENPNPEAFKEKFEREKALDDLAERGAPISTAEIEDMSDEEVEKISGMSNEEIAEYLGGAKNKVEAGSENKEEGESREAIMDELVELGAEISLAEAEEMSDAELRSYLENLKQTSAAEVAEETPEVPIEPESSLSERLKSFLTKENLQKIFTGIKEKAKKILGGLRQRFGGAQVENAIEEQAEAPQRTLGVEEQLIRDMHTMPDIYNDSYFAGGDKPNETSASEEAAPKVAEVPAAENNPAEVSAADQQLIRDMLRANDEGYSDSVVTGGEASMADIAAEAPASEKGASENPYPAFEESKPVVEQSLEQPVEQAVEEAPKEPTKRSEYVTGYNENGTPIYDRGAIYKSTGFKSVLEKYATTGKGDIARDARIMLDDYNRNGVDSFINQIPFHESYKGHLDKMVKEFLNSLEQDLNANENSGLNQGDEREVAPAGIGDNSAETAAV